MDSGSRQSTSPKPKTNIAHHGTTKRSDNRASVAPPGGQHGAPQSGALTILSSILRAPHPTLSKESQRQGVQVAMATQPVVRGRGQSPIRVVGTMGDPKDVVLPQGHGSHSPSRTPVTLPPKKSISPSRTVYIERRTPSPKSRESPNIPNRNISPGSSLGQGQIRQGQGSLMSHLPYLAQTLHQSQTMHQAAPSIPETLFQQYKSQAELQSASQTVQKNVMVINRGRVGQSPSPGQPKPAHQSTQRSTSPFQQVSTIRRTPSPAHMPMKIDQPVFEREIKDTGSKANAVNLVKIAGGQRATEKQLSDSEYRYGDLLQSINKSHESIQSQLLQGGLSPITPSEPSQQKIWGPDPAVSRPHVNQSIQSHTVQYTGQTGTTKPYGINTSESGFVPVSIPSSTMMSLPPGLISNMLSASQASQKQASPRSHVSPRSSSSPKARHTVQTSSHEHQKLVSHYPSSTMVGSSSSNKETVKVYPGRDIPVSKETVKVFPSRDVGNYSITSQISTTQPGPPNITISSSSAIFSEGKPIKSQKYQRNPFTFPATPPASLTIERPLVGGVLSYNQPKQSEVDVKGGVLSFNQSKQPEVEVKIEDKKRHVSEEMPHLIPVSPVRKEKKAQIKLEEAEDELVPIPQPYNMRFQTLANFPNNSAYRPTYRATSVAIQKAKIGCITNPAKSLDLLRQNLQKFINKEIHSIIESYLDKYFKIGIENIKLNNGEQSVTEDSVNAVCRQILEEAKKMYYSEGRISVSPARDFSDNLSETGSSGRRSALGRRRHPSDTDSEAGLKIKRKKGRPFSTVAGRSTPSKLLQSKREGPKFDPERLTEETLFVMGSRANKAMGFGATRGRLYMKHPDLFKYGGDQDDKTWLYEHQHMPATGGKSYILILQDVRELAVSDEYKDATGINVDILKGFSVPKWMIEKMKIQMVAMRTDLPKQTKYRSRSATPSDVTYQQEIEEDLPKDLPFSNFVSPIKEKPQLMEASQTEELDFLKTTTDPDDPSTGLSPFNMTGGFDDAASQSDLEQIDDETSIEPSFHIDK